MLSLLFYLFLVVICTAFLVVSVVALGVTYPFQKSRRVVHEISRCMVRIFFFVPLTWRHKVIGMNHIDRRKNYVIIINHSAMTDIPSLYFLPLNFRWVSKREVFRLPFFGQFLSVHGDICIDRGHGAEALEQLLRDGKLWLSRGASVAIFPEGTRSKDGAIHRFKTGAFTLAREAGVDILPVVMDGTRTMVQKNRLFNWHNTVTVRVLAPISAEQIAHTEPKVLMDQVREQMSEALAEVRCEVKK
ncbi:MAG: lysophospholipid acyltransferase family protein [Alistipes sp.]